MPKRDFALHKPRLHRSYDVIAVPETEEIQLQSEGRTFRLKPCNSSKLLNHLIVLLDGTRTVDDIVRELSPFDESQVLDSLQQLYEAQLVEDAAPEASPFSEDQQRFYSLQSAFFSQYSNQPHGFQSKLAQSQVGVLGLGTIGSLLLSSLADNGVGQLVGIGFRQDLSVKAENAHERLGQQCRSRNQWVNYRGITLVDDDNSISEAIRGSELLILAMDRRDPDLLERVNAACLEARMVWMPVGIRAWEGYVGPTVVPRQTACYTCYELRLKANLVHYEPYVLYEQNLRAGRQPPEFGNLPQFGHVIADIAAIEIIKLLTGFRPPTTHARVFTIDFLTLGTEFHDVLKLPRCPACGEPSRHKPMFKPWSD